MLRRSSASFSSSASAFSPQLNPRMDLDPALRDLLRDVDMSLGGKKRSRGPHPPLKKQLEEVPEPLQDVATASLSIAEIDDLEEPFQEETVGRKSPAAEFGSYSMGTVILPLELQSAINVLISGAII